MQKNKTNNKIYKKIDQKNTNVLFISIFHGALSEILNRL